MADCAKQRIERSRRSRASLLYAGKAKNHRERGTGNCLMGRQHVLLYFLGRLFNTGSWIETGYFPDLSILVRQIQAF